MTAERNQNRVGAKPDLFDLPRRRLQLARLERVAIEQRHTAASLERVARHAPRRAAGGVKHPSAAALENVEIGDPRKIALRAARQQPLICERNHPGPMQFGPPRMALFRGQD